MVSLNDRPWIGRSKGSASKSLSAFLRVLVLVSHVAAPFTCVLLYFGSTGEKPLYLSIHVLWPHCRGIGCRSAPQFREASQELRLQNSGEEVPVKMCIPEKPEASICFTGFASATCLGGVKWFEKCPKSQEIQRYTENSLGAPQSKSDLKHIWETKSQVWGKQCFCRNFCL
jgi:hypothetical protein